MGKKKSLRSNGGKQTGIAQAKPGSSAGSSSPTKAAAKKKAAGSASANPPALAPIKIGQTAGAVWKVLAEEGEQSLAALKKKIKAPADLTMAAVGWLAREDKLQFESKGRSVQISLR